MLISVHTAVGAVIGENLSNPLLAFVLGFISHFILDMIPHGDEQLVKAYRQNFKNRGMLYLIILDIISTIILVLLLFFFHKVNFTAVVIWGIIGAILPDFMAAIYEVTQKHFRRVHWLHYWTHDRFNKKFNWSLPLKLGLIGQIILIYLLLRK